MSSQPSSDSLPSSPPPPFTYDPSLTPFAVPMSSYLSALPSSPSSSCPPAPEAIATGALIFSRAPSPSPSPSNLPSPSSPPQLLLLLLQRAACDSRPHLWEVPGGGVDAADASILHGVVREVREETGLTVTHIRRLVPWPGGYGSEGVGGGRVWSSSRGLRIVKFEFEVEVLVREGEAAVRLDEREHQAFMWVSEEACRAGRTGEGSESWFWFTAGEQRESILEGFRIRGEEKEKRGGEGGGEGWE